MQLPSLLGGAERYVLSLVLITRRFSTVVGAAEGETTACGVTTHACTLNLSNHNFKILITT